MPLASISQIAPERAPRAEQGETTKYEIFAGYGYTSLNQVNQSRYGLQGVELSVTRDWGKHFGVIADGASYSLALGSGNPVTPSVDSVLFGPELRVHILDHLDGFAHALLGGEHTGGESETPTVSFAGGYGGGLDYQLTKRFSLRASGGDILSSFSLRNNTTQLGYSPHMTRSSRAAFGIVYKF